MEGRTSVLDTAAGKGGSHAHCHRVLTAATIALVLTGGIPHVASATVFFCGSGDVFCLIGSIRSANEGRGADTIILQAGTYTFTAVDNTVDAESSGGNALPSITSRVTIQGAGATETILDGGGEPGRPGLPPSPPPPGGFLRLFHIAASGKLTLHGLTIQGGVAPAGGGIFNRGTLTLSDTVLRDNKTTFFGAGGGGAVYSVGTLRIVDSRVTGSFAGLSNGAGIFSSVSLQVLRSTIDNNGSSGADHGGGIFATGTVTIKDSAIADNRAFLGGGGLSVSGTVTITNTTIANNDAINGSGGGLGLGSGTFRLTNVTVADNSTDLAGGGGLFVGIGAAVTLQNTILARNTAGPFDRSSDCFGSITSLGNNIIGNTEGCTIDLASTDFVGDPGLGVLVDNGDIPGHEYIPLLAESPAIDAGNRDACPRRDQLRNRRVDVDGDRPVRCDIGALEFIPAP